MVKPFNRQVPKTAHQAKEKLLFVEIETMAAQQAAVAAVAVRVSNPQKKVSKGKFPPTRPTSQHDVPCRRFFSNMHASYKYPAGGLAQGAAPGPDQAPNAQQMASAKVCYERGPKEAFQKLEKDAARGYRRMPRGA